MLQGILMVLGIVSLCLFITVCIVALRMMNYSGSGDLHRWGTEGEEETFAQASIMKVEFKHVEGESVPVPTGVFYETSKHDDVEPPHNR